jgi:hypothetical protein
MSDTRQEQARFTSATCGARGADSVPRGQRRSIAWIYYTVLAVLSLVVAVSTGAPGTMVGTVLFGLYATYLYRGGSVVIWFW